MEPSVDRSLQVLRHSLDPVWDEESRVLVLGSFPSVKSRESGFYYGHPQNRFWRVLSLVCGEMLPRTVDEKKAFLHRVHIALWDVAAVCRIEGSSDGTLRLVEANDIEPLLEGSRIGAIFVNGRVAEKNYRRFMEPKYHRCAWALPSTSPANAAWSLEKLCGAWKKVADVLGEG